MQEWVQIKRIDVVIYLFSIVSVIISVGQSFLINFIDALTLLLISSILDILVIVLVVYNLHLSQMVHPVGSMKYDILAGILGAAVFAAAKFNPILGFTVFIVIVVLLPFIPERTTEFVFPDSDKEEGWYLTGGIYIGLATGFYAFILSFVSLLSIGFAGFNLLNTIRGRRKKESKLHAPTKGEEPFSRFHPETMIPLLVDVFALFWGSFNLNLLIRDSMTWDIHVIWKITSHFVLFFAILFHVYFLTQKSASTIELRKETIEVRGLNISLVPLLSLFLVDFIVP